MMMMMTNDNDSVVSGEHNTTTLQMQNVWNITKTNIQKATSIWLNTFVIKTNTNNNSNINNNNQASFLQDTSTHHDGESWHFRTLFVAEITVMPFLIAFLLISFWLLNRNTHIKKTKGTTIVRRKDGNGMTMTTPTRLIIMMILQRQIMIMMMTNMIIHYHLQQQRRRPTVVLVLVEVLENHYRLKGKESHQLGNNDVTYKKC